MEYLSFNNVSYIRVFMHSILFYVWRLFEKLCDSLMIFCFVKTRYGIKNINVSKLITSLPECSLTNFIVISPNVLFLGPDYLKDEYTNLSLSINDSPHFSLMHDISCNKDLKTSNYIIKYQRGLLDWRHRQPIINNFTPFYNKYKESYLSIINDTYSPVIVYQLEGKFYIADGKHRAALCAYLKKDVRCICVNPEYILGSKDKYVYAIIKKHKSYSKHTEFYNKIWK